MKQSWQVLSQKYPVFSYDAFTYNKVGLDLRLTYHYTIVPDLHFTSSITLHDCPDNQESLEQLEAMIFSIGLIEGFSYWKTTAAKTFQISCGTISDQQKNWLQNLLVNGMAEFFYRNEIDQSYAREIAFQVSGGTRTFEPYLKPLAEKIMIPIGGGKDSIVTARILHEHHTTNALLFNPTKAALEVTETLGYTKPIRIMRKLDPRILVLNDRGFLNGHTPFSALLGFVSVLAAALNNSRYIALSNEMSANEPTVTSNGIAVNHQYSKTFAFEKDFHEYAKTYLASEVYYFSFLRPLYELQIAQLFSQESAFFTVFRSCNMGQKTNSWCGNCAKCLFVYIILYPFVGKKELVDIFGQDLYTKMSLLPYLKELLGISKHKPFDCIGTVDEVKVALYMSLKEKAQDQQLLAYFEKEILPGIPDIDRLTANILTNFNPKNLVPAKLKTLLQESMHHDGLAG